MTWAPWVIALLALFGLDTPCKSESWTRRNDSIDGVGISLASPDLGSPGRTADPLVFGPPFSRIDTSCRDQNAWFVKLEARGEEKPAAMLRGAMHGRAPPSQA